MREVDKRYTGLSSEEKSRDYFHFVLEHFLADAGGSPAGNILEVGCACGDFLHLLHSKCPEATLTGIDTGRELIEKGRSDYPGIGFQQADILQLPPEQLDRYEYVFSLTVHSLFDDIGAYLGKLVAAMKKGGRAYVFGLFNPAPLDVLVRIKAPGEFEEPQTGWNIHSLDSVSKYLDREGLTHDYVRYQPSREKTSGDGGKFSSWTQELKNGELQLVNGAQIIHTFYLLKICR